jgi:hypothetical protein
MRSLIEFYDFFRVHSNNEEGVGQYTDNTLRLKNHFKMIKCLKLNIYRVTHQYLKKFSYGFWDNQWFGRNQIYLKLKLGACQCMPSIKNLNLNFFLIFFLISNEKNSKKFLQKFQKNNNFFKI